jgi:hypothetical protein
MDVVFVEDSAQRSPSRPGMGPLIAAGAIHVPSEGVRELERALDDLCREAGFPEGEEFKWSPEDGQWMRRSLVREARTDFFLACLHRAAEVDVRAVVVVEDTSRAPAVRDTAEEDVAPRVKR